MEESTNHQQHQWILAINGRFSICQICQRRKSPMDGQIYPPDSNANDGQIIE